MAFDLKITFTGMILYVPEAAQLTVLMPRTADTVAPCGEAGCDCMEAHAARLTFDSAYGRPGSQVPDDAVTHVSLRQRRLDVPQVGSAYVQGIPAGMATAPSPARPDVLSGDANEDLDARVTVSNGEATRVPPGECWEYLGALCRMSNIVEWTIFGVEGDSLDLPLTDLSALATAGSVPRLYPIDGRVEITIWHVPYYELPPDPIIPEPPAEGTPNHHVAHIGILLEGGIFPAPLFRPGQCGPAFEGDRTRGATSLNCSGTQAPVDPPSPGGRPG